MEDALEIKRKVAIQGARLLLIRQKHLGSDHLPEYIDNFSNYLEKRGYKDYKDILLMTIDKSGKVNIFPKCLDNVSEYFL